jgi:hypothetical protein
MAADVRAPSLSAHAAFHLLSGAIEGITAYSSPGWCRQYFDKMRPHG